MEEVIKKTIPKEEFKQKLGEGQCVLVDVRTQEEHAGKNIEGTKHVIDIRQPDFDEKIGQLDKEAPYLVYCGSGMRSNEAMNKMADMGFKEIYELEGGMSNWDQQ